MIYADRRRVLDGESMRDVILKMITDIIDNTVDSCLSDDHSTDEWDVDSLNAQLCQIFPMEPIEIPVGDRSFNKGKLKQSLKEKAVKLYEAKEAEFPEIEQLREIERVILLKSIDRKWMDHIDDMDQLRQGIGLQAYGQKDPLIEYKMAGYDMFDAMTSSIQEETVKILMRIKVEQKVEREQVAKVTGTNKDDTAVREPKRRESQKVYPNDPCPCGSGKKYKQCCGRIK